MRPKIFISTVPFGELDNKPLDLLKKAGWDFMVNPLGRKLKPDEVANYCQDCDGLIAGTEDLTEVFKISHKLKIISRVGVGLDSVPLNLCRERKIAVAYTPDAVTMAVVELTIGGMITLSRQIALADRQTRVGVWKRLFGKRIGGADIGIIGIGRIGSKIVSLLKDFQPANILVNDIKNINQWIDERHSAGQNNIRFADKEEIYRSADFISLHVPITKKTRNMVNSSVLKLMK